MYDFLEELRWRGMIQDTTPGVEEQLAKESTKGYIGFDPTADSLHVGSLVPILILMHFHKAGHKPVALVGGATGMIGDPTGKSDERNLLDEETLAKNVAGIKRVLSRFIDFDSTDENAPELVNNYDWMKDFSFIDFARTVGKRITVNYMMAKDSVKKRLSGELGAGMSFTEFTYQLIQGYDFYYLNKEKGVKFQMGGSDQWGNMTTGTELVRRMNDGETEAYAMTCPLVTKADGTKFGKSEGGNIWLDADKTSVYKFYQFWLNVTDEDAEKFIKFYTFLDRETIEKLIEEHRETPHLRVLQKTLAEEVTKLVHGEEELNLAIKASQILFGKSTSQDLKDLTEQTFLSVFEGVPQGEMSKDDLGGDIVDLLSEKSGFLKSKAEARRALKENSISINKDKVSADFVPKEDDLIAGKYLLLQRGKKNYFLLIVND
ncbi:tyrosine--tRNA ligase [Flavobacteriaceae bacterium Ap0902]|nr:tyrosine--tRNA ligase [Flavobacteriaceae bacterium Ap0902]